MTINVLSRNGLLFIAVAIVGSLAIFIRLLTAMHPYSGQGKPPMFGDFEAQRHWIELTNANSSILPPQMWYVHQPDVGNDLMYWGIDYPPLTAYHSLLIGRVARWVLELAHYGMDPTFAKAQVDALWNSAFGLVNSRGSETDLTVQIMRLSALVSEMVVYFPAVVIFAYQLGNLASPVDENTMAAIGAAAASRTTEGKKAIGSIDKLQCNWYCFSGVLFLQLVLLAMPLILIDHGHFQYNAVSLGAMVWFVVYAIINNRGSSDEKGIVQALGLISFWSAVYYKQMSLYYIPAAGIFFVAQALTAGSPTVRGKFIKFVTFLVMCAFFAFITVLVTAVAFLPLADFAGHHHPDSKFLGLENVLSRMFPFKRGLYEDKVASLWCAVSPVFKLPVFVSKFILRGQFEPSSDEVRAIMVKICALTTLAASLPACISFVRYTLGLHIPTSTRPRDGSREHRFLQLDAIKVLLRTLSASALSFFLFSFQVHEKGVLLPWLPMALLTCVSFVQWMSTFPSTSSRSGRGSTDNFYGREFCYGLHFCLVALFSMYPLVIKDNLYMVYFAFFFILAASSFSAVSFMTTQEEVAVNLFVFFSTCSMVGLHLVDFFWTPPAKYPDIVTLGFAALSCLHFLGYWLACTSSVIAEGKWAATVYGSAAWKAWEKRNINQKDEKKARGSGSGGKVAPTESKKNQ